MSERKDFSNSNELNNQFLNLSAPKWRSIDSSAASVNQPLFGTGEDFNSGPIFMTLPNFGSNTSSANSLDGDVMRSVTGINEPNVAETPYWVTSTKRSDLSGWENIVRPVPVVVPNPKKLDSLSNVVKSLQSVNLSTQIAEIPELPDYVERFSSFVSTESPTAVFAAVLGYLGQAKVDYECESQRKLKITGIAYENGTPITFKVKIFRHKTDKNRCVVEFQRRSGCVVAFTTFYRRTLQALGSMVTSLYVDDLAASNKQSGLSVMPLPQLSFNSAPTSTTGPGHITLDDSSLTNLVDMCLSNEADIKREALRVLAQASALEVNQIAMKKNEIAGRIVEVITASLPSADREVGRCASLLLANLAQASVTFRLRLVNLMATMFTVLQRLAEPAATTVGGLLNKEIKRQVSRTLLLLSQTQIRELRSPTSLNARLGVLEQLSKDKDPTVVANVCHTLQAIRASKA